jgi:hypothetical protein
LQADLSESNTLNQLTDCTIKMLELLIVHYHAGKISFDDFKKSVDIKMMFLEANLEQIKNDVLKKAIIDVLKNCKQILLNPMC